MSLTLGRGQIIALVGSNGSGKSTLAKILGMLYDPDEGVRRWNDDDTSQLAAAALRERVANVFQDFQTYAETILENVTLGDIERPVDLEKVTQVLAAAGFDDDELELGRMIGLGGAALPKFVRREGGAAQRCAARLEPGDELPVLVEVSTLHAEPAIALLRESLAELGLRHRQIIVRQ